MSTRFKNHQSTIAPVDDDETVAALVKMLSGMGIERSRIDAMINKAARPSADLRPAIKATDIANDANASGAIRRSA